MLRLDASHPRRRKGQGVALPRHRGAGDGDARLKPAPFDYVDARSVEETLDLLARDGSDAKVIAGGQSLGPLLNLRLATPRLLLDVNRLVELAFVREQEGRIVLGALTRQRVAERDPLVAERCPLLAEALPSIGHVAIRNRGTIGGSLAHADPAAELPAVAVALDLELIAASVRGVRAIRATEFFQGPFTTTLEPDELVLEVRVPVAAPRTGYAWLELARRQGDFALAGAAAVAALDEEGRIAAARLALAGVAGTPVDASSAVGQLAGDPPRPEALAAAAADATALSRPPSDVHGTARYRTRLVRTLARQALERAVARAGGA